MFLATTIEIINTTLTTVTTLTVVTASLILPLIIKKNNDRNKKKDAIEEALLDSFDKYFSTEYPKNDFEWYYAELLAIIKKFNIRIFICLNCKRKLDVKKYMDYFKTVDKVIPEINNFSVNAGQSGFKIEMMVLACYKCKGEDQYKINTSNKEI
ncbi:hypothetical protein STIUS_v1c05830 [Spiroplasma sp. TIUS-1]|uniref:hypothetical protein n=1 Tax=Spiroplasma sp. TIUS-1 TaxID=216963 RepID=UPI001396E8C6|nr:hypothetical protein [Spiroplasma sp. TIUS-1]QHX36137.1 hypothetical protein STIUS_v1c05830 [Spiroplasma sp. TIUS-1]